MEFDNFTTEQFNERFIDIVNDPSKFKEASATAGQYVRMKLREEGVMRRYFGENMERVTPDDPRYQIDPENSDTGYMLIDREPDSYALRLTMRGEPDGEYLTGDKFITPFLKYASPEFEKNEMELKHIRIPITEVIRRNLVLDMQQAEDEYFKKIIDAACELTGNIYESTNTAFVKNDLTSLFNMIDTKRLESGVVIMARATLNDAYQWDHTEVGSLITTIIENGVKRKTIAGKRLITTSNTDVFQRGVIYTLTDPDFFGTAFDLEDPTFWMQKKKDLLSMAAWYYAGANIGNTKSVGKMTLSVN